MKIVLIASPYPLEEAPAPPLGLCYAAAACEAAGAEVVILDYIVRQYTPEKLIAEIDALKPDAVGTNSVTLNFNKAAGILRTIKRHNPSIVTMMGGPHVTFDVDNTLTRYPEIDVIVIGEGEATLSELIPAIGNRAAWEGIKGIAFRRDGGIFVTEPRELIQDLDSLPIPARHLLPMSRYRALGYVGSIITSRGCPNKCIFCQGRRMVGFKSRLRSVRLVVDEIEDVLSYGWDRINIADDLFTMNKKRVVEFCDELKRRTLTFKWSAFARVNTVDEEILRHMKDAGCDAVSFGIETGNQEMLKRLQKGTTLDQARQAVKWCKAAGIITHASFMVGLPGETMETMRQTGDFARELDIIYGYHILTPFPGTTLRERITDYDLEILTDDWDRYAANEAVMRTSSLAPEEINRFVHDFEQEMDAPWEELVARYWNGKVNDQEFFRVEGHYRTQLIYRMLSEDLIEKSGTFNGSGGDPVAALSAHLTNLSGMDGPFVERTIRSLAGSGFLKCAGASGAVQWYWTHNNREDRLPVSLL